jgi:hypothetical protein
MPDETDFLLGIPDGIHLSRKRSSGIEDASGGSGKPRIMGAAKFQPIVFFRMPSCSIDVKTSQKSRDVV